MCFGGSTLRLYMCVKIRVWILGLVWILQSFYQISRILYGVLDQTPPSSQFPQFKEIIKLRYRNY